jgi:hypothetical protein
LKQTVFSEGQKMSKLIPSVIAGIIIITVLTPAGALAKYSGGSGEPNDPYRIATADDLLTLADDANDNNDCFILIADIDLDPDLPGNRIFTTAVMPLFVGTFDGDGHKISNLTISNQADVDNLGLFGTVIHGQIKNLSLENVLIISGQNSGGHGPLAGWNQQSNITNCSAAGNVIAADDSSDVGGLVGDNVGIISNCFAAVNVTAADGSRIIGGLVGWNFETINECFSTGKVEGESDLGGLVGGNGGDINNCYSTGDVNGISKMGGLVGGNMTGNVTNCYSTGAVTAPLGAPAVGGLLGWDFVGTVNSSFFLDTSGPDNGVGTPLTDAQMKQKNSFAGWDFIGESADGTNDYWRMCADGVHYPHLTWQYVRHGDFTCPDGVDYVDLSLLSDDWLLTYLIELYGADANGDKTVSFLDFAILANNWLKNVAP